jgi:hypothetical protein
MLHRLKLGAVASGLSVLLVAAAAGSASAVTVTPNGDMISPANGNFGRQSEFTKKVLTRTFTITKGTEPQLALNPSVASGGFVSNDRGLSFGELGRGTCTGYDHLDALHPSCTVIVSWGAGDFGIDPGLNTGVLFISVGADPSSDLSLPLSGIGVIPRNSPLCRTRNGHPTHPKSFKYCQRKKGKK